MPDSLENARKFLESLQRADLSKLLAHSKVEIGADDWFGTCVIVRSPRPFADAIAALPPHYRKRIAEAVVSQEGGITPLRIFTCHTLAGPPVEGLPALLPELIIQQQMMIDVGTGTAPIQDVNDYYIVRQARLAELCATAAIKYENPHADLWQWYRYYKEHFPSYAERRSYIRGMFRPTIEVASGRTVVPGAQREPTGWERVDRTLARARTQLDAASAEEDFQAIGLLCREVMIVGAGGLRPGPAYARRRGDAECNRRKPDAGSLHPTRVPRRELQGGSRSRPGRSCSGSQCPAQAHRNSAAGGALPRGGDLGDRRRGDHIRKDRLVACEGQPPEVSSRARRRG
jgi:hypothetical protein